MCMPTIDCFFSGQIFSDLNYKTEAFFDVSDTFGSIFPIFVTSQLLPGTNE